MDEKFVIAFVKDGKYQELEEYDRQTAIVKGKQMKQQQEYKGVVLTRYTYSLVDEEYILQEVISLKEGNTDDSGMWSRQYRQKYFS